MDQTMHARQEEIEQLKSREKKAMNELAALKARPPSLAQMRATMDQRMDEKERIGERVAELRRSRASSNAAVHISAEERQLVDNEWKTWRKLAGSRRSICGEMWARCCEVLPEEDMTKEDLWVSAIICFCCLLSVNNMAWLMDITCRRCWDWKGHSEGQRGANQR